MKLPKNIIIIINIKSIQFNLILFIFVVKIIDLNQINLMYYILLIINKKMKKENQTNYVYRKSENLSDWIKQFEDAASQMANHIIIESLDSIQNE